MKKIFPIILFIAFLSFQAGAQSLSGLKICLDPGHGFIPGRASDCGDAETKRFESWMNHTVVPLLKKYLQRDGATVFTTRADYDSIGPCISLTQRKTIANNNNVDFFHSVHHNAFQGNANYSLVLFKQINNTSCPNGNPQWPGKADTMSVIMVNRLYQALGTTAAYPRGDYCFLGYNLGVLSTLNMPGTLSEASFWDFQPEIHRLRSVPYLRTEAEAIYHSFLEYYKKPLPAHGSLVGVITSAQTAQPLNKARVSIPSLGLSVSTDSLNNGFYRFDSLAPGTYNIVYSSGYDTLRTFAQVLGSKINRKNISLTVTASISDVALKSITAIGSNLYVRWFRLTDAVNSYHIYLSDKINQWPAVPTLSVGGTDTTAVLSGLAAGKIYYVRMKAENAVSMSPNFSKTYSAGVFGQKKGLIIDGFNRYGGTGSYQYPYHSFAAMYAGGLKNANVSFASMSNNAITDPSLLLDYNYVIWFVGDESTENETFTTFEQNCIKDYLKQGGNLLVSGSDIAYDLEFKGTFSDKTFFNSYLKSKFIADSPNPNTPSAFPLPGSPFGSINPLQFGQVYPEDSPDVIDTINGGIRIFAYNANETAATSFSGTFPSGVLPGKLLYFAFPIETIADTSVRNKLISLSVDYFEGALAAMEELNLPDSFSTSAYPNPFNGTTQLRFTLPERQRVSIRLFDITGAFIATLAERDFPEGRQQVPIHLAGFSSGAYLLRVQGENINSSLKIVLVK